VTASLTQTHALEIYAERRFQQSIDKSGECWIWLGSKTPTGYGRYCSSLDSVTRAAHRIAFVAHKGATSLNVCHTCDTPSCINPTHLFAGTQHDNLLDMSKKGRRRWIGIKGEANKTAKLREEDVLAIRMSTDSNRTLGQRYGVSSTLIGYIKRRKVWTHV
jgi:hypothetical protein